MEKLRLEGLEMAKSSRFMLSDYIHSLRYLLGVKATRRRFLFAP